MSKRNLALLIIVLVITGTIVFLFMSFYQPPQKAETQSAGTNFLANFLPFGKSRSVNINNGGAETNTDISGYTPETTPEAPIQKLVRVSSMPVAGFGIFMKEIFINLPTPEESEPNTDSNTQDTTVLESITNKISNIKNDIMGSITATPPETTFVPTVRYVEKATGNVYETFADNIEEKKISTTMIPGVHNAFLGNNGESVVVQYLKSDGKTTGAFVGILPKEILGGDSMQDTNLKGVFLPEKTTDISISTDSLNMFYLFNVGDGSVGISSNTFGDKKVQVFNSAFNEWLSQYPNEKLITLTTKAASTVPGYVYAIDPINKTFNKILGGINGMTTLTSPNGKLVLYNDNNLKLSVYDIDTKDFLSLGVNTMPEKCVWAKSNEVVYCAIPKYISSGKYPDTWYQGEVSFSDDIWEINIKEGSSALLIEPDIAQGGEPMDITKLGLDQDENFLFFVNKKDSYLWKYNLN